MTIETTDHQLMTGRARAGKTVPQGCLAQHIRAEVERYAYSEGTRLEWAATEFLLRYHPHPPVIDLFGAPAMQSCLTTLDNGGTRINWETLEQKLPEITQNDVDLAMLTCCCHLAQDTPQASLASRYNRQLLVEIVACAFDTSIDKPGQ